MKIKCWGSRGSVPVSGRSVVKYGGDTTCIEITASSGHHIIIDAGTGIRNLGKNRPVNDKIEYHMVFTHAHWDHLMGFAFFPALQYSNVSLIIQDREFSGLSTQNLFQEVLKGPFFPIGMADMDAEIIFDKRLNNQFSIGSIDVASIPTSHPGGGLGYRFQEGEKVFVFLTDNELMYDHPGSKGFGAYLEFCTGADLLFHDAEYTQDEYDSRKAWGHSSVPQVIDLGIKAKVKQLGLFHLTQDRTDDQMDAIVTDSRNIIDGAGASMECFAVPCGWQICL